MDVQHEPLKTPGSSPRPLRVLIVEDSEDDAALVIHELRRGGFDIDWERADSRSTFEERLTHDIDIVLSDFNMPGFSGFQALQLLQDSGMDIPFILISGTIGEDTAVQAMQRGAADYLLKDRLARLCPAVARVLEKEHISRSLHDANLMARGAMDSLMAHVAILNADGVIVMVNRAWTEFALAHSLPGQTPVGAGANYLLACDRARDEGDSDAALVGEGIRQVLSSRRERFEHEYACHSPTERRWFACRVTRFGSGRGVRVVVMHSSITAIKLAEEELKRDVAERIRTEEKLRQSQQRYSDLLQGVSLLAVMIDREGAITFCNEFALQLTGWTWEEVRGQNWHDTFRPSEVREESKRQYALSIAMNASHPQYQVEIITREGARRTVAWSSTPLRDTAGEIVGYANIGEDITDRLMAEAMLQESRERFQALIEYGADIVSIVDIDGIVRYQSPSGERTSGHRPAERIGFSVFANVHPEDLPRAAESLRSVIADPAGRVVVELRLRRKSGEWRHLEITLRNLLTAPGVYGIVCNAHDITERKQAEEEIRRSHEHNRALIEAIPQIAWTAGKTGVVDYLSTQWRNYTGFAMEETLERGWPHFIHPDDYPQAYLAWESAVNAGDEFAFEFRLMQLDGAYRWFLSRAVPLKDAEGGVIRYFGTFTDIDDQKRTEEDQRFLAQLGATVRVLADPETLILKVTEAVCGHLNVIRCAFIEVEPHRNRAIIHPGYHPDIPGVAGEYPLSAFGEEVVASLGRGETVIVNDTQSDPRTAKYYGGLYSAMKARAGLVVPLMKNGDWVAALCAATYDEPRVWNAEEASLLESVIEHLWLALENARLLKHEQTLRREIEVGAQQYARIVETAREGITVLDRDDRIAYVNSRFCELTGYPAEELLGKSPHDLSAESQASVIRASLDLRRQIGRAHFETLLARKDGTSVSTIVSTTAVHDELGEYDGSISMFTDITNFKRAEAERDRFANHNRLLLESSGEGIYGIDVNGRCTFANRAGAEILGYAPHELVGQPIHELIHHSYPDGAPYPPDTCPKQRVCRTGIAFRSDADVFWRKDGTCIPVEYAASALIQNGAISGAVITFSDITERKRSKEQLNSQLARLAATSAIDSYITNSVDLRLTLNFIAGQAATLLHADAIDVLVYRESDDSLECMAAVGFVHHNVSGRTQRVSEGQAGRTMLERKMIHITDVQAVVDDFAHADLLSREHLTSYTSIPLIAKARVVGVLEVFHAKPFDPDEEWVDLLRALAGQCAIAIENTSLFESLQKTNHELRVAYDATIEGWSRALDMRDYETEGHSQRVAAITMRLARAIGITGEDLVHIRRGALLHDIGKMAIPDRILSKEGPLTPEEREIMQRHVQYAFDFLSPVPFLRKALDIPYCHHERWDGTGYPNKLKGRQIPLAARLFALADVWDALRSDRPYRKAWSEEKTREHIQAGAGAHFDPEIVDVFLCMDDLVI